MPVAQLLATTSHRDEAFVELEDVHRMLLAAFGRDPTQVRNLATLIGRIR
jgi:hypothetical protein